MLISITAFLGRFHPLLVHLPIGFIIIAVLVEWRLKNNKHKNAISYIWLASAISSGVAALMGWFLANQGSYDNWTLFFHRWLGIIIGILALYAWWIRRKDLPNPLAKKLTNIGAILILAITGHLGGNMTHGSDYLLEYAPSPIQKLLGYGKSGSNLPQYTDPDSVYTFNDIIYPTLENKCLGCHNDNVQNGGLNMSSIDSIKLGGDGGPVIVAGDISSELLNRVTLPITSAKFMPTSGSHMTYHEVRLLEWWITQGADYNNSISNLDVDPSIQSILLSLYSLDVTPRPWIEKTIMTAPEPSIIEDIAASGLKVNLISSNNGWIEISNPIGTIVTVDQLDMLSSVAQQITWIQLANSGLTDDMLMQIKGLDNLTKLKIQGNPITSNGIRQLENLSNLETLNLTNTQVDDGIFELLDRMPKLKNLYLWQSAVTDDELEKARSTYPDIEIESGVSK